jgi:hypothetical protein
MEAAMSWIIAHRVTIRGILLALLIAGIAGPWVFDEINVPAEYTCHPPNYRLYGDFCGVPLSGAYVAWAFLSEWLRTYEMITSGGVDVLGAVIFRWLGLVIFLPFAGAVLLFLRPHCRRASLFQAVACLLAAGLGILVLANGHPSLLFVTWGVWVYALAAMGTAALETLLLARKTPAGTG